MRLWDRDVAWFDIKVGVILPWNLLDIFWQKIEQADKLEQLAFLSHIWLSKYVSPCSVFIFYPFIKQTENSLQSRIV